MLDKNNAIRILTQYRKKAGPRKTYILKCECCPSEIRVRCDALKTHSGKCGSCSHQKLEFESLYNCLRFDWRGIKVSLTFNQFLEFTKTNNCHYCLSKINWIPYSTVKGQFKSRAYYLDRKDNNKGYSKKNCVVCCTRCNLAKSNEYSYNEWFGMTSYFRDRRCTT